MRWAFGVIRTRAMKEGFWPPGEGRTEPNRPKVPSVVANLIEFNGT